MGHRRLHRGICTVSVVALVVCLSGASSRVSAAERIRRFALVLGANLGGQGRTNLHYATRDADLVAKVLTQLGGVSRDDLVVLQDVTAAVVQGALARLRGRLQNARAGGERVEVFFYYSGHSDETGLLIDGDKIPYRQLRETLKSFPADVRVAVLDSCASGVLTRSKGGFRGPPFLADVATKVVGHAFLASASADEVAQESERLRGSFFTHHLVAGLRGAADADRDRRVTLSEAYQYAFNETLAHTESSRSGAQHANYDMRLVGSGGLVLTDLRTTGALLVLGADLQGQLYVRDSGGNLVTEIRKTGKRPLSLALDPGQYRIRMSDGNRQLVGTFTLTSGGQTAVTQGSLRASKPETHASKGAPPVFEPTHLIGASYVGSVGLDYSALYQEEQYAQAYAWLYSGRLEQSFAHGAELRYLHRLGPIYLGVTGGYKRSEHAYSDLDARLANKYNDRYVEKGSTDQLFALVSAEWHLPSWRWWQPLSVWQWIRPVVGVDVGLGYVHQRKQSSTVDENFPEGSPPDNTDPRAWARWQAYLAQGAHTKDEWTRTLPAFHTRMRLGLQVPVSKRLRVEALGHLGFEISRAHLDDRGYRLSQVDRGSLFIPRLGFSMGVVLGF